MTRTLRRNNSAPAKSLYLEEIAKLVGGQLAGDPRIAITGVAGIKEARKGDITFLGNARYLPFLSKTEASAVLVSQDTETGSKAVIRVVNPSAAFTKVAGLFNAGTSAYPPGIHPTAIVDPDAEIGGRVHLGPHVVIGPGVHIGEGTVVVANTFIGADSVIGRDGLIYSNVTIREGSKIGDRVILHSGAVIGSDGFGYETVDGVHIKIPQTGYVLIEDDVEVGANTCIDRGRFDKTWIQKGTKIDNQVQIAHNVVIGPGCILVSQVGISGSSDLGHHVVVAGQAGITGHVSVGDETIIGAQAGVSKSIPAKSVVLGSPAKPILEQKKIFALIARLPEMFKDLSELKKKNSDKT